MTEPNDKPPHAVADIKRAEDIVMIAAMVEAGISLAGLQADGFAKIQIAALLMDGACRGAKRTHDQGLESLKYQMTRLAARSGTRARAVQDLTDALRAAMERP